MDFLQAIRETQEKMWWTRVWTNSYNKSVILKSLNEKFKSDTLYL